MLIANWLYDSSLNVSAKLVREYRPTRSEVGLYTVHEAMWIHYSVPGARSEGH